MTLDEPISASDATTHDIDTIDQFGGDEHYRLAEPLPFATARVDLLIAALTCFVVAYGVAAGL